MTDRAESGRSVQDRPSLYARFMAHSTQFIVVIISLALMLGGLIGGFALGRYVAYRDLPAAQALVRQLQTEGQKLRSQINELSAKLTTTQDKLDDVQAALHAIKPAENTYNVNPNESLIVGGGHLTIGLVGSPANQSVTLNINNKQQTASIGDVIKISPDPSTNCVITVQSFDMFSATLNASCSKAH